METLSNNLSNVQVEHYNAVSTLQDLSMNKFIEEKLEEKSESASEESDRGFESKKEVFLDNNEKMKKVAEISTTNIEKIYAKKEKNKEQIEDDTTSVVSKNLVLDNSKKYNFPFIIGTDEFLKNKNIGLVNEIEENEEEINKEKQEESDEDPDIDDFTKDIAVDEKTKKKWEKIKKRKTIKKKKQKEKLKKQKNKNKNEEDNNSNKGENKDDFDEEVKDEIKVPIENENAKEDKTTDNLVVSSGKGSSVPPPPPPPPKIF